jgi:hypothetical protein
VRRCDDAANFERSTGNEVDKQESHIHFLAAAGELSKPAPHRTATLVEVEFADPMAWSW